MLNNEFPNQKIKIGQLDRSTQGKLDELNQEELDNVVGGYFVGGTFWNPYPNPWTPAIRSVTIGRQIIHNRQHDDFIKWLRS